MSKAEWKKSPLAQMQSKRVSDMEQLRMRIALLEEDNHVLKVRALQHKDAMRYAQEQAKENARDAQYFKELCGRGVLLEDGGEFKFLQGDDLTNFLERQFWSPFSMFRIPAPIPQHIKDMVNQVMQARP
jgi:hypothetical protein